MLQLRYKLFEVVVVILIFMFQLIISCFHHIWTYTTFFLVLFPKEQQFKAYLILSPQIQLTPQQLQALQLQVQNNVNSGQQIVVQTPQAGDQAAQFTQAQVRKA